MIRCGLPFGFIMFMLVFLWAIFSVLIGRYATSIRKEYVKIGIRAFIASVVSLLFILLSINVITIFFN